MRINLVGECDKRPVLYTLLKICQELGDVLLITSSSRINRLSDTKETYGHYQNVMIAVTHEGLDDFLEDFVYDLSDFNFVVIDNIIDADADVTIYVQGYVASEQELDNLEYIDSYSTINLYADKMLDTNTPYKLEEFESMRDMCPVCKKVATKLATILAPYLGTTAANIEKIALKNTSAPLPKNSSPMGKFKKGGK